jgi:hypothetical protein
MPTPPPPPVVVHGGLVPYNAINATDRFNVKRWTETALWSGAEKIVRGCAEECLGIIFRFRGKISRGENEFLCAGVLCLGEGEGVGDEGTGFPWRREVDFWC